MGNRAHVIFTTKETISPAVYLHGYGGPDTIYAALEELERREVRHDADYQCARFIGLIHELLMSDQLSLGIINGPDEITLDALRMYDHGDNGIYVIESDKDTVKVRRFKSDNDQFFEFPESIVESEKIAATKEPNLLAKQVWLHNWPNSNKRRS